jgi:hypothetical protein
VEQQVEPESGLVTQLVVTPDQAINPINLQEH